ncbi:MAG TPA: immunoglobulin domain-containing protein [Opitutaceae bacterium]|jgi:hypothetical protein
MNCRFHFPALRRLAFVAAAVCTAAAVRAQTILPDATAGTAYSFQITTSPAAPTGTTYAADGLPAGLVVDAGTGMISGTTTTVGTFDGNLSLTYEGQTAQYPYDLTVDPAANTPVITSPGAAVGTVGTAFSYTLTASNNPASFNIAQLPAGLTASGNVISGTPTAAGQFFTSVSGNNSNGQGKILVIMWTINPAGAVPDITSSLLANGEPGQAFTYTIAADNTPTTFSASGLPTGLTLDATSGVIGGTPAAAGISTVTLSASNQNGAGKSVNLTLTIGDYSAITSSPTLSATVNVPFTYTLTASNTPYTFALTGLPAGLSYNNVSGIITGTPTTSGTYTLAASATNAVGTGAATSVTLTVANSATGGGGNLTAPYILENPTSQGATVGSNATFNVTAVGSGSLAYQWAFNGNAISGATGPALTLDEVTAANAGNYTVTVTNSIGSATSTIAALTVSSLLVPPAITGQPQNVTASVGMSATFTVTASGSAPLTYQWTLNGQSIAGATAPTYTVPSVAQSDAGTYAVIVSNNQGSMTSDGATLTVSATAIAPIWQWQPTSIAVAAGGTASFSVGVVGSSPISYQWYFGSNAIPGAIGPSYTIPSATSANVGSYSVVITNPGGTVTSSAASLSVNASGSAPVPVTIALQPQSIAATIGSSATFAVAVTGDPTVTYQWRKNQAAISGATSSTFTVNNVQNSDAGTYDVIVANGFSATISAPTPLTVTPVAVPSHLANISVLSYGGTGPDSLTAGFSIGGSGSTSTLIRAIGPTLTQFRVSNPMADPQLSIYSGSTPIATNDNWGGVTQLSTTFSQVGAFSLPGASLDAAVLAQFNPGVYTAVVQGANGGTGTALLELYDADTAVQPTAQYLNLSIRAKVGASSPIMTGGFSIAGTTGETLLIRAVGPTLAQYGVSGSLADPQIAVFNSSDAQIASNVGWGGSQALSTAFSQVQAFGLPANSHDSAVLITLGPGVYTAQVTSSSGGSGVALLEIYVVPQ